MHRLLHTLIMTALAACVLCACASKPEDNPSLAARLDALRVRVKSIYNGETVIELTEADESLIKSSHLTPHDQMCAKATLEFGAKLSEADLHALADLVLQPKDSDMRWLVVGLLIDRRTFDDAARLVVADALAHPDEASYRLWKWMETSYGERTDYKEISLGLVDSLLKLFDAGTPADKLAIAGLFRQGSAEAAMSTDAFKEAIGYPKESAAAK